MFRKILISALLLLLIGCSVKVRRPILYLNTFLPDSCDIELIRSLSRLDLSHLELINDEIVPIELDTFNNSCDYCDEDAFYNNSDEYKIWLSVKKKVKFKNDSLFIWNLYNFNNNDETPIKVISRLAEVSQCDSSENAKFMNTTVYIYSDSSHVLIGNKLD